MKLDQGDARFRKRFEQVQEARTLRQRRKKRRMGTIESADLLIQWQPGQASALDKSSIRAGRDVGNVIVQRRQGDQLVDVPYDVTFAFVFHAFRPNSPIHKDVSDSRGVK
jgi:hypothetical protein